MKARDHEKIMRQMREQLLAALKEQQEEELFRLHYYFDAEVADRERIMVNYANAIDRLDATVAVLEEMLIERGMDKNEIDLHVGRKLAQRYYMNDEGAK